MVFVGKNRYFVGKLAIFMEKVWKNRGNPVQCAFSPPRGELGATGFAWLKKAEK